MSSSLPVGKAGDFHAAGTALAQKHQEEFMLGTGPRWVHLSRDGKTTNSLSAEAAADFMFSPTGKHRFGWFPEPAYAYSVAGGHQQSIGMRAGFVDWYFLNRTSDLVYHIRQDMKAARQFGIVILLLVSYLTPAMACLVSDVQINAEERACCQAMKNHCEQMGMPASHGCCHKAPKSAQDNALDTKTVTHHSVALAVDWLSAIDSLNASPVATGRVEHADGSPPQSPLSCISVLRI